MMAMMISVVFLDQLVEIVFDVAIIVKILVLVSKILRFVLNPKDIIHTYEMKPIYAVSYDSGLVLSNPMI